MVNCRNAQKVQAHLCFEGRGGVPVVGLTGVWKPPNYLQVFLFYFILTDVLGYMLEASTPYGVQVFKIGKRAPEQRGGAESLAHNPMQSLQIEALGSACLWAAATEFLLWSLALHIPVLQSSW